MLASAWASIVRWQTDREAFAPLLLKCCRGLVLVVVVGHEHEHVGINNRTPSVGACCGTSADTVLATLVNLNI